MTRRTSAYRGSLACSFRLRFAMLLCSIGSRTAAGPPAAAETATEGEKTEDGTDEAETTLSPLFAAPAAPPPPAREGGGAATDRAAREDEEGGDPSERGNSPASDRRARSPEEAIRRSCCRRGHRCTSQSSRPDPGREQPTTATGPDSARERTPRSVVVVGRRRCDDRDDDEFDGDVRESCPVSRCRGLLVIVVIMVGPFVSFV